MPRRTPLALALLVSLTLGSGCFGRFSLTRAIYGFNEGVSGNRVVQSLVMWGLLILPVYELGALVDIIILNPIEFFTGSNPMAAAPDDKTLRLTHAGREFEIEALGPERLEVRDRRGGGAVVLDRQGDRVLVTDASRRPATGADREAALAVRLRRQTAY
jgi:hypothetical protein